MNSETQEEELRAIFPPTSKQNYLWKVHLHFPNARAPLQAIDSKSLRLHQINHGTHSHPNFIEIFSQNFQQMPLAVWQLHNENFFPITAIANIQIQNIFQLRRLKIRNRASKRIQIKFYQSYNFQFGVVYFKDYCLKISTRSEFRSKTPQICWRKLIR